MKKSEKREENMREKARGYVVDGRIRKKGWVSTGVNWLVWWANVCLLAASEPVNHYGLRKRSPTTFTLFPSLIITFSPSLQFPSLFSFFVLLSLFLSLVPSFLFYAFVPFISLSTKFTPLLHATSTLQCCLPPPILHI